MSPKFWGHAMKKSTIFMMTAAVILAALLLLAINLIPLFSTPAKQTYIPLNNVRGSAVIYDKKPFTLNFDQQNELVDIMNRAVLVKKSDYTNARKDLGFDKIVIYPFSGNLIEIQPIDYVEHNLVFSAPAWNNEYYMMELSAGTLQRLIQSAHD